MGKIAGLAVIVIFAASNLVYAGWFDSGKSAPAAQPASASSASSSASASKAAPSSDLLAKKAADFNDTEWSVKLNPMSGKGEGQDDTLTFIDGKMVSQNMAKEGYDSPNFSTRLQSDGTFTWETMQSSDKLGTIFWRGDVGSDGTMHGVVSMHDPKGNTSDFTLVSVGPSKKITPPPAAAASAQSAAAPAAAAAPAMDSGAAASN